MARSKQTQLGISSHYGEVKSQDKTLWHQIVNDWQTSGMTQRAFSAYYNLNKHTLNYWRGKFLAEAKENEKPPSAPFVPLAIQSPGMNDEKCDIRIHMPQGYVLTIPLTADNLIKHVLSCLGVSND